MREFTDFSDVVSVLRYYIALKWDNFMANFDSLENEIVHYWFRQLAVTYLLEVR